MPETPIGQRLKILIEKLGMDARTFSQAMDVAETTTRNYLNRGTKPGSEYLEKISNSFSIANMHWLLTGQGEPFLSQSNSTETNSALLPQNKNFSHSQIIGTNAGTATQNQGKSQVFISHAHDDVAHLQALVEQLRSQLADKERTIQILLNQQPKP